MKMKRITKTLLVIIAILMVATTTIGTSIPKVEATFELEEEEYIDDIPFDIEKVILQQTFKMEDEEYIDDIPFDTEKVVEEL